GLGRSDLAGVEGAFLDLVGAPGDMSRENVQKELDAAGMVLPRVTVPGDKDAPEPGAFDPKPVPAAWSDVEILRHKDFADFTDAERELAKRLIAQLASRGPTRRSRRLKISRVRGAHGAAA